MATAAEKRRGGYWGSNPGERDNDGRFGHGGGGGGPPKIDGVPASVLEQIDDQHLRDKLAVGSKRWKLSATSVDRGSYGTAYRVKIAPKAEMRKHERRLGKVKLGSIFYDPELATVDDAGQVTLKPESGYTAEPPASADPDIMWRGISGAELESIRATGEIHSTGEYNVGGEAQEGTTSFADDPRTAQSYAAGFAPWHLQPTAEEPGYLIGVRREGLPQSDLGAGEIDAPPVSADRIETVIEVKPYATTEGYMELEPARQFGPGTGYMEGSSSAPSQQFGYREVKGLHGDAGAGPTREGDLAALDAPPAPQLFEPAVGGDPAKEVPVNDIAHDAAEAIGEVVTVPADFPRPQVRPRNDQDPPGLWGQYEDTSEELALELDASPGVAIHEYGHHLDNILGGPGLLSEGSEVGRAPLPEVAAVQALTGAISGSDAIHEVAKPFDSDVPVDPQKLELASYLLQPGEELARAWTQYIMTKRGRDTSSDAWLAEHASVPDDWYWSPEAFKPIAEAFDALFREKGWLK